MGKPKTIDPLVIVGGGPAGLKTAIEALKRGFEKEIVIFEEDEWIGRPPHCAGLVSVRCLKEFSPKIPSKIIVNRIKGARVFFANSGELIVSKKGYVAYVLDREELDSYLANQAVKAGANIVMNAKVTNIEGGDKGKVLLSNGAIYRFSVAIIATGAREELASKLGFGQFKGKLPALQWEMEKIKDLDPDLVEIYLGTKFSKGLFAWIIPLSDDKARVGVATAKNPLLRLEYMTKKEPLTSYRFSGAKVTKVYGGIVITLGGGRRLVKDNVAIIGDVAGQTKPTTGGGLYYIDIASKALGKALSKGRLDAYSKDWWRKMRSELRLQLTLRLFLNKIRDDDLATIYRILKDIDFEYKASSKGDMDFQSNLLKDIMLKDSRRALRHPRLIYYMFSSFIRAALCPSL